ncbi:phosphate-repressible phosphate permease [Tothia fuscella]|uniref:Phosphate transporter n=1 Tax=Tothia fuscella TaxID=1048955 RepID=A0A9P4NZF7_9PEZI|nr:phosphate-repressible phosphate permease [Tothia fuscella]
MAVLTQYRWILAIVSIAFCVSSFGNGANDVANSYATSVAARSLTMPQVGFLSAFTEFVGAVALGSRVTGTIKNGIINISRFQSRPATLILVMGCAEVGSATWLILATKKWAWSSGSVSQIAASWAIAPLISAAFPAILFGTLKYGVLERKNPFEKAIKAIPFYLAFTAAMLALFIVVENPGAESLEDMGAGTVCGIIFGVFFGTLLVAYVFFVPYFKARVVKNDPRIRFYHIPLGPLLLRENPPLYFPGDASGVAVKDFYEEFEAYDESTSGSPTNTLGEKKNSSLEDSPDLKVRDDHVLGAGRGDSSALERGPNTAVHRRPKKPEPEERFLGPVKRLPFYSPARLWATKFVIRTPAPSDTTIVPSTYAQVASAMMMSIAHGSNDVANALGPWVAVYNTYQTGAVTARADTPIWIIIIAGLLLGAGFWFFGHHIVRALGNKITQVSPTRGFSVELGSAIAVLMASSLALPVSTTQCLTGSVMGVALMNYDLGAVNWKQLAYIFLGWVLTLPAAGLISGLLCLMALNTHHFRGRCNWICRELDCCSVFSTGISFQTEPVKY